jgi:hypothetical protein
MMGTHGTHPEPTSAQAERKAIVAWLRGWEDGLGFGYPDGTCDVLQTVADQIERGDHVSGKSPKATQDGLCARPADHEGDCDPRVAHEECTVCGFRKSCAMCVRERNASTREDAVIAEREACAKLVDESAAKVRGSSNWWGALLDNLAVRIRARGKV